eukprot:6126597-Pyramimonas_sp.AAC.1
MPPRACACGEQECLQGRARVVSRSAVCGLWGVQRMRCVRWSAPLQSAAQDVDKVWLAHGGGGGLVHCQLTSPGKIRLSKFGRKK